MNFKDFKFHYIKIISLIKRNGTFFWTAYLVVPISRKHFFKSIPPVIKIPNRFKILFVFQMT